MVQNSSTPTGRGVCDPCSCNVPLVPFSGDGVKVKIPKIMLLRMERDTLNYFHSVHAAADIWNIYKQTPGLGMFAVQSNSVFQKVLWKVHF